ncbi:MAG: carboxylesterase family protein, partial [Fluviibacter sp.]
ILYAKFKKKKANPADILNFSPAVGDLAVPNATVPSSFKVAATNNALVTVPMLYGGAQDELELYVGYFWQGPPINEAIVTTQTGIDALLGSFYREDSARITAIKNQYPLLNNASTNFNAAKALGRVLSDYNPTIGISNCLYLQTSNVIKNVRASSYTANPIYQFEFADPAAPVCGVGIAEPCPPFVMTGPVHSSELNYFFPNFSNTSAMNAPNLPLASQLLADQMVAYWGKFAATGNPNKTGLPNWPVYNGSTGSNNVLKFIPGAVVAYDADAAHQCSAFWANTTLTPSMYSLPTTSPY